MIEPTIALAFCFFLRLHNVLIRELMIKIRGADECQLRTLRSGVFREMKHYSLDIRHI